MTEKEQAKQYLVQRAAVMLEALDRVHVVGKHLEIATERLADRDIKDPDEGDVTAFGVSPGLLETLMQAHDVLADLYQALGREWDAAETKAGE